jgi:hypothetical protein
VIVNVPLTAGGVIVKDGGLKVAKEEGLTQGVIVRGLGTPRISPENVWRVTVECGQCEEQNTITKEISKQFVDTDEQTCDL